MASQLKVDTLTGVTTAGSIDVTGEGNSTTTNLQQGLAKAWCNLNGAGTIAIKDSNNISSVTDSATGQYVFIYTSNMANDDYALSGSAGDPNTRDCVLMLPAASKTVSQVGVRTGQSNNTDTIYDASDVSTLIHGDLA